MPDNVESAPITERRLVQIVGYAVCIAGAGWGAHSYLVSGELKALEAKAEIAFAAVKMREAEVAWLKEKIALLEEKVKSMGFQVGAVPKWGMAMPTILLAQSWAPPSKRAKIKAAEDEYKKQHGLLRRLIQKYQGNPAAQIHLVPPPSPQALPKIQFYDASEINAPASPSVVSTAPTTGISPLPSPSKEASPRAPSPRD